MTSRIRNNPAPAPVHTTGTPGTHPRPHPTTTGGTHPAGWTPGNRPPRPATGGTTPTTGGTTPTTGGTTPTTGGATPANTTPVNGPAGTPAPTTTVDSPPAVHASGPIVIEGPSLNAAALKAANDLDMSKFGTTTLTLPQPDGTTKSYMVRDMQYDLGDGKVGVRIVPVKDNDPAANKQMDDLIRKQSGLKPDDPIFALIAYIHPEEHDASLSDAATRMLKTEMGNTHLGAYWGEGKTTNSPENYHQKTWSVNDGKPYPANVQIVSMDGVPQAELNKNLRDADSVLNKGVEFPPDYKNDPFRTVDLNTNLMFYKDWLKDASYLHDDSTWKTYCAEHKTIVTNIGLNVPHNADSFKEIFGADEGPKLWDTFKTKFKEANGREFTPADETHFTPLWKKEGLTADQIRPPTKEQYDAYQKARFDGSLQNGTYVGYKPLPPGKGMAWRPETTADLVKNFMETYAPFNEVGGYASVASLMGFKDTIKERMGIDDQTYLKTTMPVANKIMIAEGMARAPADPAAFAQWAQKATGGLYVAFGGKPADLAPGGTPEPAAARAGEGLHAGRQHLGAADHAGGRAAGRQAQRHGLRVDARRDSDRHGERALGDGGRPQVHRGLLAAGRHQPRRQRHGGQEPVRPHQGDRHRGRRGRRQIASRHGRAADLHAVRRLHPRPPPPHLGRRRQAPLLPVPQAPRRGQGGGPQARHGARADLWLARGDVGRPGAADGLRVGRTDRPPRLGARGAAAARRLRAPLAA